MQMPNREVVVVVVAFVNDGIAAATAHGDVFVIAVVVVVFFLSRPRVHTAFQVQTQDQAQVRKMHTIKVHAGDN